MISFSAYHSYRNLLIHLAPYFKVISLFFGILTLIIAIKPPRKFMKLSLVLTLISFAFLTASLILLGVFHNIIFSATYLSIPGLPEPLKLRVPLWIESAKIFFWTLLTVLIQLSFIIFNKNEEAIRITLIATSTMLITTGIFDPFSNPFPQLNQELNNLEAAIQSGLTPASIAYLMNFFYRAKYFYNSQYMWIHPPLLFLSYAFFVLAFPIQFYLLFKKDLNLVLENTSYVLIRSGYLFLTAGMLIGYPWAVEAWQGQSWWWSAKINVSITMWLLYTAYLHARLYIGRKFAGRFSLFLGIISFLLLIFTYLTTYLIPGVHSYA